MFTHNGMSVSAWVILDGTCTVDMHCFSDNAQFEFGPNGSGFGLVLSEPMIDKMAECLAEAKEHFRELDQQAAEDDAAQEHDRSVA